MQSNHVQQPGCHIPRSCAGAAFAFATFLATGMMHCDVPFLLSSAISFAGMVCCGILLIAIFQSAISFVGILSTSSIPFIIIFRTAIGFVRMAVALASSSSSSLDLPMVSSTITHPVIRAISNVSTPCIIFLSSLSLSPFYYRHQHQHNLVAFEITGQD